MKIVLASGSAIRAKILNDARIDFEIVKPNVDEAIIKQASAEKGLDLQETAAVLADAKSLAVDVDNTALVIGSDQIMEHEGIAYDKPASLEEAADRLKILQGSQHTLINAVSIAQGGRIVHRIIDQPVLHMRTMKDTEIEAYIDAAGPAILSSVGAYQVELLGSRLFDRIEGDFFAVLGLSLYPLLRFLRDAEALDF